MPRSPKIHCLSLLMVVLAACDTSSRERPLIEYLQPIGSAGSLAPHLASTTDGRAVLSWLEPAADGTAVRTALLGENSWASTITVGSGEDLMVNWADFPSVTPITDTLWAAHWLRRLTAGGYAYDVVISVSTDSGATWSKPQIPHDDGTATEHGFVSLFPSRGAIGAIWLDGRNTVADAHESGHGGGMTLRSALINKDGSISDPALVDDLVCDCCQTDVALGSSGPIAVYRNRTDDEIRDIHVARFIGGSWKPDTAVANDGWKIDGCPVNGPAVAARENTVAVAWFTAANDDSQVRMAWSDDSAASFADAIAIDVDRPAGRVDIELLDKELAVVSWLRGDAGGNAEICLQAVRSDGRLGPVHVVASTSVSRDSGFPQMIRDGNALILVWTDRSTEQSRIATARIRTEMLYDENTAN